MAQPAVRFHSLSEDFNTPVVKIGDSDPKTIVNSGSNKISDFSANLLKSLNNIRRTLSLSNVTDASLQLKEGLQKALGLRTGVGSALDLQDTIRQARGLAKAIIDNGKLSKSDLNKYIDEVFKGDPVVKNLMRLLNDGNNPSSKKGSPYNSPVKPITTPITTGKPFPPYVKQLPITQTPGTLTPQTTVSTDYDIETIAEAVEKLSGTPYTENNIPVNNNQTILQIVTVGNLAYDAGLPNVMGALKHVEGVNAQTLERAMSIMLLEQVKNGNFNAFYDLVMSDALVQGTTFLQTLPRVIKEILKNFDLPVGSVLYRADQIIDAMLLCFTYLDPNWNKSQYDGQLSIRNVETLTPILLNALRVRLTKNVFDEDHLEVFFNTQTDIVLSAMIGSDPTMPDQVKSLAFDNACVTRCVC